ncbi:hypothetical protein RLOC_00000494 [Lonchura striata]|uniref:Uncharacterized protein n=1 Tax=Lonchura striata TaxID=40157 RepID=A0A218V4Q6_9PASE|nr:hypothetical protein RLOC_00000494 [Lonchura striata domestica]
MVSAGRAIRDHLVLDSLPWEENPSAKHHPQNLPQAPSKLPSRTSRAGESTASLGNLFQCLTTLTVKNFFPISNLNTFILV